MTSDEIIERFADDLIPQMSVEQSGAGTSTIYILPYCSAVHEGDGFATVLILANPDPATSVSVRIQFSGTATFGSDHKADNPTITITPTSPPQSINIPLVNDDVAESLEYITVTGTVLSGDAQLYDAVNRIYVLDDDGTSLNLLTNPGFELGLNGWTESLSGAITTGTDKKKSGNRSIKFPATGSYPYFVEQEVAVTSYLDYLVEGWMFYGGNDQDHDFQIVWLNAEGSPIQTSYVHRFIELSSMPENWYFYSGCVTAPPGAVKALFRLGLFEKPGFETAVWFDDVGFYRTDGTTGVKSEGSLPEWLRLW